MVRATIRAPRMFPRKRRSTIVTRMKPSREVMEDRVGRVMDEVAPVVEGDDLHARGQDAFRSALHFFFDALERCIEIGAFAHEHDA